MHCGIFTTSRVLKQTIGLLSVANVCTLKTVFNMNTTYLLNSSVAACYCVLEQWMYHSCIRDISHLKAQLIEEWQKFDQKITGLVAKHWLTHLRSCVQDEVHF